MSGECHPIRCPEFSNMSFILDEGLTRPPRPPGPEAVAAAAAVRSEFAVRAGGRACTCPRPSVLDRTPGTRLREAQEKYAALIAEGDRRGAMMHAVEHTAEQWREQYLRSLLWGPDA